MTMIHTVCQAEEQGCSLRVDKIMQNNKRIVYFKSNRICYHF